MVELAERRIAGCVRVIHGDREDGEIIVKCKCIDGIICAVQVRFGEALGMQVPVPRMLHVLLDELR
jgi:hypothetical protein